MTKDLNLVIGMSLIIVSIVYDMYELELCGNLSGYNNRPNSSSTNFNYKIKYA